MATRKLLNGKRVPELKGQWEWVFQSKCPAKWLHIDCENGRIYVQDTTGKGNQWREPSDSLLESALIAIKQEIRIRRLSYER